MRRPPAQVLEPELLLELLRNPRDKGNMEMLARGGILMVGSAEKDQALLQELLQKAHETGCCILLLKTTAKAKDYLEGVGEFSDRRKYPLPTLILLELELPDNSSLEFLKWIRFQPGLKRMRVTVWTASHAPEYVRQAYEAGANSYLVRPSEGAELRATLELVERYWLRFSEAPNCES